MAQGWHIPRRSGPTAQVHAFGKAQLNRPYGVAFDAAGDLYIADTFNQRIRRVKMSD